MTQAEGGSSALPSPAAATPSQVAAAVFMADVEARTTRRRHVEEQALRDVAARERLLFRVMVVTATIAPVLVVIGFVLLLSDLIAVGTLSAVVGLLDGIGSAGLRRLQGAAAEERRALEAAGRHEATVAQALAVALMNPDEKRRAVAMSELSTAITESVRGAGVSAPKKRATASPARPRSAKNQIPTTGA